MFLNFRTFFRLLGAFDCGADVSAVCICLFVCKCVPVHTYKHICIFVFCGVWLKVVFSLTFFRFFFFAF